MTQKPALDDVPAIKVWGGSSPTSIVIAVAAEKGECGWYKEPCQSPDYCIHSCLRLLRHETAKMSATKPFTYSVTYRPSLDETAGYD